MKSAAEVLEVIDSKRFDESMSQAIRAADGATDEQIARAEDWVQEIRQQLRDLIEEMGDSEDIDMALALAYIEFKSRWVALNTKMNYRLFHGNAQDPELMMQGTAISLLLATVEDALDAEDVDAITNFLAQPLKSAA